VTDAVARHIAEGRAASSTGLPDGYRLHLRSRHAPDRMQASLFAPGPDGQTRVSTLRFTGMQAGPGAVRIIGAAARRAPAPSGAAAVAPAAEDVADRVSFGQALLEEGGGLSLVYGPVTGWLAGRRLAASRGKHGSVTVFLDGAWDASRVARLSDDLLWEVGDGAVFHQEVTAGAPAGTTVLNDQYHPQAAVLMWADPCDLTSDPLGRQYSRRYGELQARLAEQMPIWSIQPFWSNEGAVVALRITPASPAVPRLAKHARMTSNASGCLLRSEYRPCLPGCRQHSKGV